jgi:hypothetical protein
MALSGTTTAYRQQWVAATFNGIPLQGVGSGVSINVTPRGGEVDLTEGTDGGDINLATDQGVEISITFRETSIVHNSGVMQAMHRAQNRGAPGATFVLTDGTGVSRMASNCFVSMPSNWATGDKTMGQPTYTFVSNDVSFFD